MNVTVRSALIATGWIWFVVFVLIGVLGAGLHVVDQVNSVADRPQVAAVLRDHVYGGFYLFLKATDAFSTHFFSSIFWLGLGANLLAAEIWIHLTRLTVKSPAPQAQPGWLQSDTRALPGATD